MDQLDHFWKSVLIDSSIILTILDLLVWLLIAPILIPIGIIFYIYKSILLAIAAKFRKDLSPISLNDLMVARTTVDKKEIVDIGFILKVKGDISLSELQKKFREHFLSHSQKDGPFKTLYCNFEMFGGYLFFKRCDHLILEEHIREDSLNEEEETQNYFSTWLHSHYHNDTSPRWEMLLLKRNARKESYVAFRMHHGLIDGFGMLMIVDKLCGQQSPYLVQSQPPLSFSDKVSMLFPLPRQMLEYILLASTASKPFPEMTNLDKTDKMLVSWSTLDLYALKSIRRQLGVSFSSLLYVLQTGALRRHLIETGRRSEITETLPVFHTIPRAGHPITKFTNHWTYLKLHTPFRDENPLQRLQQTEKLANEFLNYKKHISSLELFVGFANLLPTKYSLLNLQWPLSVYKASLSSMVRANTQYTLFGNDVTNIYHTFCTKDLCPLTVLYTTTASHNNQIDITFSAAPQLVRNQHEMNRIAEIHVKNELKDLLVRCDAIKKLS